MTDTALGTAHGRVNLIGEHTDYNDGFAMPAAIPQMAAVVTSLSPDGMNHVHSVNLRQEAHFPFDELPQKNFSCYVQGCIEVLRAAGHDVPPVTVEIDSSVPVGVGLSSSAALEVATLRSLRSLLALHFDDIQLAQLAQRAEIEYAGVHCGILDQMACSLCRPGYMLFLDIQTLEHRLVPMPAHTTFIVLDTGTPRTLAGSGYNQRRSECEQAAQLLDVVSLRTITAVSAVLSLPAPLNRRARHVVSENARVIAALQATPHHFGELMNASHDSLEVDYEVSTPALNAMVAALRAQPGVLGARLTGAGFGGACVALVETGAAEAARHGALAAFGRAGYNGKALV